jgi:hypothetical protein
VLSFLIVSLGVGVAKHAKLSFGVAIRTTLGAGRHASDIHDIQLLVIEVACLVASELHLHVLDGLFALRRELWRHLLLKSLLLFFLSLHSLMLSDFISQGVVRLDGAV